MKSKDFVTKILKGKSIPMGLSAGQARLLSITARKSDCEYKSMQLSHQKLAISRQLEDISNEYQNSLDQTKLIYDYYGTGTTNQQLSYGLLMTPSELNEYYPNMLTDSSGRVVLNSAYAAAAAAAGIPKEGLNGLPSKAMRDVFIDGLLEQGLISGPRAETFKGVEYNQLLGLGAISSVVSTTTDISFNELVDWLSNSNYPVDPLDIADRFFLDGPGGVEDDGHVRYLGLYNGGGDNNSYSEEAYDWVAIRKHQYSDGSSLSDMADNHGPDGTITLGEILSGDYSLIGFGRDERNWAFCDGTGVPQALSESPIWEAMMSTIEGMLGVDAASETALAYARQQVEAMVTNTYDDYWAEDPEGRGGDKRNPSNGAEWSNSNVVAYHGGAHQHKDSTVYKETIKYVDGDQDGYIGYCVYGNCGEGRDDDSDISGMGINISSVFKAYLTFFAQKMQGVANTIYSVGDTLKTSNLVGNEFTFTINTGAKVTEDEMKLVSFYDTILNQICTRGWTENDNIDDNKYLQEMLQNGMMYLTKVKDDGYYYQSNYATDSYIKTVEDETAIAQAEAKYQTEKQRLSSKENSLDLKMKNLDTEISALTTEYDTVKGTITKNIERTFKRYSA